MREKAIVELKAAIQAYPSYPVAYVYLAEAYADTQLEESIHWLEEALRWRPNYGYAHFCLGKLYRQRGENEAAKDAYARATRVSDARNSLGELLAAEGAYQPALTEFGEAVRLNRRNARAWRNLAWWTVRAGDHSEDVLIRASGWARRSLELDRGTPFEWLSHDALGWIMLHMDQLTNSEQELVYSIAQRDDRIQNRYHLACLYHRSGDLAKARNVLTEALQLPESGYWREKAVVLMQKLNEHTE
jgi:Tfp pilus assembly protein PilF